MSSVQPPGSAPGESFSTPRGADTPGAGQVLSVGLMKSSMVNGWFSKWLAVMPWAASVQVLLKGGEVRLTSFCGRQEYAAPSCATWVFFAVEASDRPSTCFPLTLPQEP